MQMLRWRQIVAGDRAIERHHVSRLPDRALTPARAFDLPGRGLERVAAPATETGRRFQFAEAIEITEGQRYRHHRTVAVVEVQVVAQRLECRVAGLERDHD